MIWGGEAAAVQPDGRANPNQTMAIKQNAAGLKSLLDELLTAHRDKFGTTVDLLVGLQLTHSGRFCRPNSKQLEPRIAYHHPLLDAKFGIDAEDDSIVWTDQQCEELIQSYVDAAELAQQAGYRFVDVKCCHGYLLHEFLVLGHAQVGLVEIMKVVRDCSRRLFIVFNNSARTSWCWCG